MLIVNVISVSSLVVVCAVWQRPCLSNSVDESEHAGTNTTGDQEYAHVNNNVTELTYDKEDIISLLAAEFLFLIASDHVFLPPPSAKGEDFELHKNAQILANLLTQLTCTRQIYSIFNATAYELDEESWYDEASGARHLFTGIFERIIGELQKTPEMNARLQREKNHFNNESVRQAEFDSGESPTNRTRTFEDIGSAEVPALERRLLDSELVKKVFLTMKLLMLADERLADVPQSATLERKRLETVKGLFRLGVSENLEVRLRIQKIFDDVLGHTVKNFQVEDAFCPAYADDLCDALLKEMENDQVVREEFYCMKIDLENL